MINPKILILPDIHGRTFYQKALCEAVDKGAEIVCLGDYLDPQNDRFGGATVVQAQFKRSDGASAPRHPRHQDFRRKSQQRGRPTGAGAEGGVPLKGAVTE